jgi:hypothetical protein
MDFHIPDYVQVSIEGNDATPYVISYHRRDDLCEIGESFDLSLSDQYPWILDPYNDVIIKELYGGSTGYVLRGYIIEIAQNFADSEIKIRGLDKSTLLNDYYIAQELKSNGQTVDYWINRIIQMTGLSVHFDAHSTQIVEVDTPLGYQTAADAVLKLERLAAYYAKYDSQNDYIKIFRLSSSQPVITISTSGSNKPIEVDRKLGTENTRNVVKIYGGYKYDPITKTATQVFDSARTEMPELLVDKTSVVMSSAVRSQTYAHIVANRILAVVNSLDDEQLYMLAGFYPTVHVGNGCYIDVDHANYDYKGNRMITSIETSVDSKGATTTIGVGKKCPRIAIQLADPPIFITTTKDGVGVSWDGGNNFVLSNTGLIGSDAKFAWSIAVNQYGQSMVLTADGPYRRWGTGGVWHKVPGTLPDPPNNANDFVPTTISGVTLAKVVEEPTRYNKFHILARRIPTPASGISNRTWVYSTSNFGYTWNCKQLYVTQEPNLLCPSGISWSVYGSDIESSPVNNVYVLVNGGTPYFTPRFVGIGGTWPNDLQLGYQKPGQPFKWSTNKAKVFWATNKEVVRVLNIYTDPYSRNYSWCILITHDMSASPINPANFYMNIRVWVTNDKGENWVLTLNQKVMWPAVYFKPYENDPNHMRTGLNDNVPHSYMITWPEEIYFDYIIGSVGRIPHWRIPVYSSEYSNSFDEAAFQACLQHGKRGTFNYKQRHYIAYIDIFQSEIRVTEPVKFYEFEYKKVPYLTYDPPTIPRYIYDPPIYHPFTASIVGNLYYDPTKTPPVFYEGMKGLCGKQTRYASTSTVASLAHYVPLTPYVTYDAFALESIGITSDYHGVNGYLTSDLGNGFFCGATGHPLGDPPTGYTYDTRERIYYGNTSSFIYSPYINSTAHNTAYAEGIYFQQGWKSGIRTQPNSVILYIAPGNDLQIYPGFETVNFQLLTFDVARE